MLILTWYFISWYVNKTVIPTPFETWDALVEFFKNGDSTAGGTAWSYIKASFGTLLKGFALALVFAFPIGLLIGSVKVLDKLFSPALNVLRPIAPVAWAPVLIILLESDANGAMMVVFIGAFFPILTTVSFGVRKIDKNLFNATKVLGATWSQTFFKITVPASIPYLMNGTKTALGIGWMCIVSAELYASGVGGLGNYITNQAGLGAWPQVYAGIVIVGILGLITVLAADLVSKKLNKKWGVEE
jgi:NitT/TauT family transport system permease protein